MKKLTEQEEKQVFGGEMITLATVMALMAIGLVTVICYKLFFSTGKSKVTLPGGFTFQWE